ncbi:MAG: CC0125/CC1285 family lipoprotein [Hyphococcus sp.]
MKRWIAIAAALLLGACAAAGPAAYGPAADDRFGYSDTRIEDGRYRIVYRGSGGMPPEIVENYALRRAAELTIQDGYDWFRVVGRDITGEERGGVGIGAGFGTGSVGRRSGVGVGVGGNVGQVGARQYFTVRMEVLMGEGETPEEGNVYGASAILDSLGGGE